MNQYFFKVPFATSGDVTAIPQPIDGGGDVSFTQGYGPYFAQDPATFPATAKDIDRAKMNWLFNSMTGAINQYQVFGTPEFITAADNGGSAFSYDKNARVRYRTTTFDPWHVYTSRIDTNTDLPTVSASWYREDAYLTTDQLHSVANITVGPTTSTITLTDVQNAADLIVLSGTISGFGQTITIVMSDASRVVAVDYSAVIGSLSTLSMQTASGGGVGALVLPVPTYNPKLLLEKNASGVYDYLSRYIRGDTSNQLSISGSSNPVNCSIVGVSFVGTILAIDNTTVMAVTASVNISSASQCSFDMSFFGAGISKAVGTINGDDGSIIGTGVTRVSSSTMRISFKANSTGVHIISALIFLTGN